MKTSLSIIVLAACGFGLAAQTHGPSCCQMQIDASQEHAGLLRITITNVSEPTIDVRFRYEEVDYTVQVTFDDGRPVNRTAHGNELLDPQYYMGGSRFRIKLKQGRSRSEELDLRKLFELKAGRYNAVLSRDVVVGGSTVTLEASVSFSVP